MSFLKSNDPLLVIIGPSGSGKSSAVQELAKRGIIEVTPSWTTRPPRQGEAAHSVEHTFVSEKQFDETQAAGFFLEVVQLFHLPFRYGLPRIQKPSGNRIPLIMLRAPLLPLVPKHYNQFFVYQIEDDYEKIKERLTKRQSQGELQGSRLKDYEKELALGRKSADSIFTNQADIPLLANNIENAMKQNFKV